MNAFAWFNSSKHGFIYTRIEEGRAEGQAETIRKMLAAGIPASAIAEALEITIEQCEFYR